MRLEGMITALITPFKGNDIDFEGLKANIRDQLEAKVSGLLVLGTTGEAATISDIEREAIIRLTVEEVDGRTPVLVGTGCNCTRSTIEQTIQAEDLGADIALVVLPYYNRPTQKGIELHVAAIAEAVNLPLILYNHPGRTGLNLLPETLNRISRLPSVIGLKDCSASLSQLAEYIRVTDPESFGSYSGNDDITLPTMAMGGRGIISVVGNVVPRQMLALTDAMLRGDLLEAQRWHYHLMPLFEVSCMENNPMAIKEIMRQMGKAAGPCRLPLCDVSVETRQRIRQVLELMSLNTAGASHG